MSSAVLIACSFASALVSAIALVIETVRNTTICGASSRDGIGPAKAADEAKTIAGMAIVAVSSFAIRQEKTVGIPALGLRFEGRLNTAPNSSAEEIVTGCRPFKRERDRAEETCADTPNSATKQASHRRAQVQSCASSLPRFLTKSSQLSCRQRNMLSTVTF